MSKQDIFAYIDSLEQDGLALWQHLVEKETFSSDKEAVNELAEHLDTYCAALGFMTKVHYYTEAGAGFTAQTPKGNLPGVLLMGHLDTVHPRGSFQPLFREAQDFVYGPGIYDCKGGVAVAILAMKALKDCGYQERQLKLVLTGDEEVAHTLSQGEAVHLYEENLQDFCVGFNMESGYLDGSVVTSRKGGAIIKVCVAGISAHSGKNPEQGASAVREAARQILAIEALTDFAGTVYNCGHITGGTGANVIPDSCEYAIGLRYCTNVGYEEALAHIKRICTEENLPHTSAQYKLTGYFPAMEKTPKTDALFELYQKEAQKLGCKVPAALFSGGCSDASYVAKKGTPTLCSVGVRGVDNHTKQERAITDSLLERTKILVATILSLPADF